MFNKLTAIINKDVKLRFEGPAEWLFFLILPLVFTLIAGGGIPGDDGDSRIYIPVVDEDGGQQTAEFLAALAGSTTIEADVVSRAEAIGLLNDNEAGAILIIPAGFSDSLTAEKILLGAMGEVILQIAPNSNVGLVVEQEVSRAIGEIARPLLIARNAVQTIETIRPFPDDSARVAFFSDTAAAAEANSAEAPKHVDFSAVTDGETFDSRAHSSAGQLLTWVFIPLLGVSTLFAVERALGTLRRLVVSPTRKSTYLLGTIGGQFLLALVQMAILIIFGIFVMNVPWGREPLALALVLCSFGLAGVALGTALGTFVKTESQALNLSILFGMLFSLLGGAWVPMEIFPEPMKQFANILPTTWAMRALTDITMRGQGLAGILPEAAVLLGFAVVFFIIGVWRFRFE